MIKRAEEWPAVENVFDDDVIRVSVEHGMGDVHVVIPAREVRMREVQEAHLEYLLAFWHYMTADLTLTELRQVNDHIECDLGTPAPEEYSI